MLIEIFIGLADVTENELQGVFELACLDEFPRFRIQDFDIIVPLGVQFTFRHKSLKSFIHEGQTAVDEITEGTKQFAVMAVDKFPPGEIGIPLLGAIRHQEVTD
ncbi:hypothetical protein D3C81_1381530 [compost metagenome]